VLADRVVRWVAPSEADAVQAFLASPLASDLLAQDRLIRTRPLAPPEAETLRGTLGPAATDCVGGVWFEHDRIPFASYPYEWPPEMLYAAAELTLDLALAALPQGFGLKDATPGNVLFRGPRPVFVDVPSFEQRNPLEVLWRPQAQFVRTFLLPLLVNRRHGTPLADVFLSRRDGLEPEEVYRALSWVGRLRPPALGLVSLPYWLTGRAESQGTALYRERTAGNAAQARFILESLLRRLQRTLRSLRPEGRADSAWADYTTQHGYSPEAAAAKEDFVRHALAECRPGRVLDIGANTGHFSLLAARQGASVVALDLDPVCVGAIWRHAHEARLDVLPLVVNLARPPGGVGWVNRECPAFLERAAGAFDAVLMLAVLHHLLVTERIPLREVLALAARLTRDAAIIEFVGRDDPMFRRIARGREALHADWNEETFVAASEKEFTVVRSLRLPGMERRLYLLRKPRATATRPSTP
jgi:SAM-dependent methyltransferase